MRNDYRDYLSHSAKGTKWKNHKYLKKINGRYYYGTKGELNRVDRSINMAGNKYVNAELLSFKKQHDKSGMIYVDKDNGMKELYEGAAKDNKKRIEEYQKRIDEFDKKIADPKNQFKEVDEFGKSTLIRYQKEEQDDYDRNMKTASEWAKKAREDKVNWDTETDRWGEGVHKLTKDANSLADYVNSKAVKNIVANKVSDLKTSAKNTVSKGQDKVSDILNKASSKASSTKDLVSDKAKDAASKGKEIVSSVKDLASGKAKETVNKGKQKVSSLLSSLKKDPSKTVAYKNISSISIGHDKPTTTRSITYKDGHTEKLVQGSDGGWRSKEDNKKLSEIEKQYKEGKVSKEYYEEFKYNTRRNEWN